MTIKNPVEKAATMVEDVSYSVSDLVEIEGQIKLLMKSRRGLFKIEQVTKKHLTSKIEDLKRKRKEVQLLLRRDYPVFNIECLSWRDRDGYPLLAVFDLDDPKSEIGVIRHTWRHVYYSRVQRPWIDEIDACFDDVYEVLETMAKKTRKSIRLRTIFSGVIPQDVREEIAVMRDSFTSIFIIAEVDEWDVVKTAPIRRGDPLVIGYEGGKFFLIAAFDTTPLEAYIESLAIEGKKG